jgi:hypothetical protein
MQYSSHRNELFDREALLCACANKMITIIAC